MSGGVTLGNVFIPPTAFCGSSNQLSTYGMRVEMIKAPEDHNKLDTVTDQLRADEHHDLAAEYSLRQASAQKAHTHLRRLGDECTNRVAALGSGDQRAILGKRLADWLTDYGWTPPWPLEIQPDEDED